MKNKELSDKYCSRFVAEGLIKSALCASTLGFALSLFSGEILRSKTRGFLLRRRLKTRAPTAKSVLFPSTGKLLPKSD